MMNKRMVWVAIIALLFSFCYTSCSNSSDSDSTSGTPESSKDSSLAKAVYAGNFTVDGASYSALIFDGTGSFTLANASSSISGTYESGERAALTLTENGKYTLIWSENKTATVTLSEGTEKLSINGVSIEAAGTASKITYNPSETNVFGKLTEVYSNSETPRNIQYNWDGSNGTWSGTYGTKEISGTWKVENPAGLSFPLVPGARMKIETTSSGGTNGKTLWISTLIDGNSFYLIEYPDDDSASSLKTALASDDGSYKLATYTVEGNNPGELKYDIIAIFKME